MLDDEIDMRRRRFALAGGGSMDVDVSYARVAGLSSLTGACVTMDDRWSIDYLFEQQMFRLHERQVNDGGFVGVRPMPMTPEDPYAALPPSCAARFRSLAPYVTQLGVLADALPIAAV